MKKFILAILMSLAAFLSAQTVNPYVGNIISKADRLTNFYAFESFTDSAHHNVTRAVAPTYDTTTKEVYFTTYYGGASMGNSLTAYDTLIIDIPIGTPGIAYVGVTINGRLLTNTSVADTLTIVDYDTKKVIYRKKNISPTNITASWATCLPAIYMLSGSKPVRRRIGFVIKAHYTGVSRNTCNYLKVKLNAVYQ